MQRLKVVLIFRNDYVAVNHATTHLPSVSGAAHSLWDNQDMEWNEGSVVFRVTGAKCEKWHQPTPLLKWTIRAHLGIVEGFEVFMAGLLCLFTVWWVHTDRPQWPRCHCHKQQQDITPAVNCMKKIIQLAKQSRTRFEFRTFLRHNSDAVEKEMHKFICERWTNIYHMLIHSENLASLIYSELVSE